MKNKISLTIFASLFLLVLCLGTVNASTLAEWSLTSNGAASNTNANINAGTFINGSGTSSITFSANGAYANSWTASNSFNSSDYFQISISPKSGYNLTLSQIDFGAYASATGPTQYDLRWSKSSGFSPVTLLGTYSVNSTESIVNKSTSINVLDGETLYLRWNAYNSSGSAGTFRINDDTLRLSGTVKAIPSASSTDPEEIQECSTTGNKNNGLSIDIDDISVINGFGDDEDFWYPFDEIEIEIEIENTKFEEIKDIELEWGLWSVDEEKFIIDDSESDFDLEEDEGNTITISFKLEDLDDLSDSDDFTFYVWANGEIDDEDSAYDENNTCISTSESIDIITDDDFIIIRDLVLSKTTAECGSDILLTAEVWNIGDDEQDEVSVLIKNEALGINELIESGDIDEYDKVELSKSLVLPDNAEEKTYSLKLEAYDEDNDIYENEEDDESRFYINLNLEGNCQKDKTPQTIVSANLESGGKAGQELIISSTISNLEDEIAFYNIQLDNYESWADLVEISPSSLSLGPADTGEITITLNVKKDISGEKTFDIVLKNSEAETIGTQPVQISVEKAPSLIPSELTDNALALVLGILIIALIIAIIVVIIVKIVRK